MVETVKIFDFGRYSDFRWLESRVKRSWPRPPDPDLVLQSRSIATPEPDAPGRLFSASEIASTIDPDMEDDYVELRGDGGSVHARLSTGEVFEGPAPRRKKP